jgi:small GTP-binding protein
MTLGVAMDVFNFDTMCTDNFDYRRYWGVKELRLVIWDTAGQERFQSIVESYMRNLAMVILVIDVNSKESIWRAEKYLEKLRKFKNGQTPYILLIINKADLVWHIELNVLANFIKKYSSEYNLISGLRKINNSDVKISDTRTDNYGKRVERISPWADLILNNSVWMSAKYDPEKIKQVIKLGVIQQIEDLKKVGPLSEFGGFQCVRSERGIDDEVVIEEITLDSECCVII